MRHGNCPDAENPEKEKHHDQSNRHSDRRPVRNRSIRTSSSRIGIRLGIGRRIDPGRFGARCEEGDPQERTQSQRIGVGIGFRTGGFDPGASCFGASRQ